MSGGGTGLMSGGGLSMGSGGRWMSGFDGCSIIPTDVATSLPYRRPSLAVLPPSPDQQPPSLVARPPSRREWCSCPRDGGRSGRDGGPSGGTEVVNYSVAAYPSLTIPCFAPFTVPAVRNSSDARNSSK